MTISAVRRRFAQRSGATFAVALANDRHVMHEVGAVGAEQSHPTSLYLLWLAAGGTRAETPATPVLHLFSGGAGRLLVNIDFLVLMRLTYHLCDSQQNIVPIV